MKKSKILLAVAILVIIGLCAWMSKNKETLPPTPAPQTSSIKGCYVATLAKDVYTLKIGSQQGQSFDGSLSFKNFEKDSSSGTYKGTYKNDILLGDYSFSSEGMDSVMQVIFKKSGDDFIRGYGDLDETGTRFANLQNISYDSKAVFKVVDCASI
jgi:hypothetical protein